MKEMQNKGTYTNFKGESVEFNYVNEISLSQKVNFIMEHAGMVVSSDIGYASVLRKPLFDYCLIKYFTDIELFEKPEDFSLNMIDKFLADNHEKVLGHITKAMGNDNYNELLTACNEAIEFRKSHFSDYREEVSDLLQAIRELVIKPDTLSEFFVALTNAVNSFADKDDIDMNVVNKLVNIIPILEKMGSVDVAKAIIAEHNKDVPSNENDVKKNAKPRNRNGKNAKDNSALKIVQ